MQRYLMPRLAAPVLLILIALTVSMRGIFFLGDWLGGDWAWEWQSRIYGVISLVWVYIWLAFRQLLQSHVPEKSTDPLIPLIIGVNIFQVLMFPVFGVAVSGFVSNSLGLANLVLFIVFAIRILRLPHNLFGFRESYAGTLIASNLAEALLWGMLSLEFIVGFDYKWYSFLSILPFVINLFNMIIMYRIFRQAERDPNGGKKAPLDQLIDKIGADDDE